MIEFNDAPVIFTTGAFLKPLKITDSAGKNMYVWAVSEFVDDSFLNGEVYNPPEFGNSKDELITEKAPVVDREIMSRI
jgi:hypothetical protein